MELSSKLLIGVTIGAAGYCVIAMASIAADAPTITSNRFVPHQVAQTLQRRVESSRVPRASVPANRSSRIPNQE